MTTAIQKTQPLTPPKPSALKLMAARMNVDPDKLFATMKSTVFQKATDEELLALTVVANEYDLNPFLKEIYAFPAKGGGIVPIVSVDGWNKMLIRQPDFDGIEFQFLETDAGELVACTAIIHVKGRSHPCKVTEYLSECKRNTDPWNNMPRRMLRNRTLCQASRIAFGFSGVKHEDEAIDVEATISADPHTTKSPNELPPAVVKPSEGKTPQAELEALLITNDYTFSQLQKWGMETGNIENADSIASFAELPTDVCRRLLRAKSGLLTGLAQVKES